MLSFYILVKVINSQLDRKRLVYFRHVLFDNVPLL